ncbi:NACHT domain-containing protein [Micromonospora sp. NPDC049366]|uniref:NACHT domain-containing protein n=1 Tax=Micromonospora sp. NPDC049366 TaxID=3364271 RepID=UPI0037ADDB8E
MAPSAQLTYRQAMKIIANGDEQITRLDRALGGVILGASPLTGGASLALVDPKNELVALLRHATGNAAGRIKGKTGKSHYDLLEAAHTVLGLSAFFDAFKNEVGSRYKELNISDDERHRIASRLNDVGMAGDLEGEIDSGTIPLPSPMRGFVENLPHVEERYRRLADLTLSFVEGLSAWPAVRPTASRNRLQETVTKKAAALYRDRYTRLAVDIPEFSFWASSDEHAATRAEVRAIAQQIDRVQGNSTETLAALEQRLSATILGRQAADIEARLASSSAGVLTKNLWRSEHSSDRLTFPRVIDGFISPRYRLAVYEQNEDLTSESYWEEKPVKADLAGFLASYIAHPDSTQKPLIILGHPGAGKSLLTEIVAARLPPAAFTPILVRLRRVNADAELHQQIEAAIEATARERISWGALCRESPTTKVVIFDGFDELIQATGVTQSGYIEKIARFQSEEWQVNHSVIPIITSRTLVMDRTRVPKNSVVIRLEHFDDAQVTRWVDSWNHVNRLSEEFIPLDATRLIGLGGLARQPLLLTLLAIYDAESGIEALAAGANGDISQATLYKKLLDSFISRQVREKAPTEVGEPELRRQEKVLRRDLALAAFAMFNRGHQYIAEEDLARDLDAFMTDDRRSYEKGFAEPVSRASKTIAAFFFVHVAQADEHIGDVSRRTYEFLHATFGEYLVAEHVCFLLADLTQDWERTRERLFVARPDDGVFRALLSHQPLTSREATTAFARSIIRESFQDTEPVRRTLSILFRDARKRGSGLEDYEPVPFDPIVRLANYTANIVTLAALSRDEGMEIEELSNETVWRSTVYLWRAGLSGSAYDGLMLKLSRVQDRIVATPTAGVALPDQIAELIAGNLTREAHFRLGHSAGAELIRSRFSLDLHNALVNTVTTRWPVPQFEYLTYWDLRNYYSIFQLLRNHPDEIIAPNTAMLLVNLLVDDGPWMPQDLVTEIVGALLHAITKNDPTEYRHPLPSMYALVVRCPYLLDAHHELLSPMLLKGRFKGALDSLLLLRSAQSVPDAHRDAFITASQNVVRTTRAGDYGEPVVSFDMVKLVEEAATPDQQVLYLLDTLRSFGEIAWRSVPPSTLVRIVEGRQWRGVRTIIGSIIRDYLSYYGRTPASIGLPSAIEELRELARESWQPPRLAESSKADPRPT